MKDIEELKRILHEHKYELENEYGVKEIGIFGSYIKNQEKNERYRYIDRISKSH